MLKLAFATLLVASTVSVSPVFAAPNTSAIGRGCTLDPFTKTMRCIDFDNCTTDKNGKKTCPVVVTPTKSQAKPKADTQDYLVVTLKDAFISN